MGASARIFMISWPRPHPQREAAPIRAGWRVRDVVHVLADEPGSVPATRPAACAGRVAARLRR